MRGMLVPPFVVITVSGPPLGSCTLIVPPHQTSHMSQEESGGVIRTVTEPYRSRSDAEMNILGMLLGLGLVMVMLPLLPFIVVVWIFSKLTAT